MQGREEGESNENLYEDYTHEEQLVEKRNSVKRLTSIHLCLPLCACNANHTGDVLIVT